MIAAKSVWLRNTTIVPIRCEYSPRFICALPDSAAVARTGRLMSRRYSWRADSVPVKNIFTCSPVNGMSNASRSACNGTVTSPVRHTAMSEYTEDAATKTALRSCAPLQQLRRASESLLYDVIRQRQSMNLPCALIGQHAPRKAGQNKVQTACNLAAANGIPIMEDVVAIASN
jgi:hypothetical protein